MKSDKWWDKSWNPIVGCSKVSAGCENCYAERMAMRLAAMGMAEPPKNPEYMGFENGWTGKIVLCEHRLDQPLRWRKPRRIFVCSMSDLFHPKVPFEFIDKVFAVIALCPQHTFYILTKHAKKMLKYFSEDAGYGFHRDTFIEGQAHKILSENFGEKDYEYFAVHFPIENVHIGVTAENQKYADERIPILLQIPAAVRFVSLEPMLGSIDLNKKELICETWRKGLTIGTYSDWVILGCETGPRARLCGIEDMLDVAEQCKAAGIPLFVKAVPIDGKPCRDITRFPQELQRRELPRCAFGVGQ